MEKLFHIKAILFIISLYFSGGCGNIFPKFDWNDYNNAPIEKSSVSLISELRRNNITAEIIYSNFNFSPQSARIINCSYAYTNNSAIALLCNYFYFSHSYWGILVINKLKLTDIIFPFHDFW
jgi:hypothetical protein